jgi:hypothetical protein
VPRSNLLRLTAIGLSACALAPATAAAMPAIDGQGVAAGGGPGVTPQTLSSPAHTGGSDAVSGGGYVIAKPVHHATPSSSNGGDVVSGGGYTIPATSGTVTPQPPNFPTNTKALPVPAAKSTDDGIDTGVLIALGAAALLAIGGLGLVMATRPRTTRRRQPA